MPSSSDHPPALASSLAPAISVEGAGGAGKSTLADRAVRDPQFDGVLVKHVTSTNRPMREGERQGVDYHFRSTEEMENAMADYTAGGQEWIEMAMVHGIFKGSKRSDLEAKQATGASPVIVQDFQGARTYRRAGVNLYRLHVLPPDAATHVARLKSRQSETGQAHRDKLAAAVTEIRTATEADYILLNDDLERAYSEFTAVVTAVARGTRPTVTPAQRLMQESHAESLATELERLTNTPDISRMTHAEHDAPRVVRLGGVLPRTSVRTA